MRTYSAHLDELAAALSAAQGQFIAIPKTDTNPFFKSKYAGLPQVVAVASPILAKNGLSVSQFIGYDDGGDTLTTWLLHKSGQYICESMRLHSAPAKGLSDVQGQGSATTYSRRYSYMSILGLVADDDDDGALANRHRQAAQATPAPAAVEVDLASADQRATLYAAATEVPPSDFANAILTAASQPTRSFETQDQAIEFAKRLVDRLPARLVDSVLAELKKVGVA